MLELRPFDKPSLLQKKHTPLSKLTTTTYNPNNAHSFLKRVEEFAVVMARKEQITEVLG
jgi:hypothetical protein